MTDRLSLEYGPARADEIAGLNRLLEQALTFTVGSMAQWTDALGHEHMRAVRRDGRVVAGMGIIAMGHYFGGKVIFSFRGNIWQVNEDGSSPKQLTFANMRDVKPRFSPDGQRIAFTSSLNGNPDVYVMPAAGGELHTQDAVTKEWVRPDATLINAAHFIAENGELNTSIGLKQEDDTWVIDGDLQGKKVNAQLPADSTPGTWLAQALGIRQLLASENPVGAEHSIAMWVATDPSKLTDAKTKVLARKGKDFTGHSTTGALEADVTLDKSGALIIADMQVGPQKVKIERVYVNGSF